MINRLEELILNMIKIKIHKNVFILNKQTNLIDINFILNIPNNKKVLPYIKLTNE